jgi:hypothetical protein
LPHLEPEVANMAEFWVWSGPREGEVIAVTWPDIDSERGTARINKTARGARRKAPKTYSGRREIKLLPPALEALKPQKAYTRLLHKEVFMDPGTRPRGNDKAAHRAPKHGETISRSECGGKQLARPPAYGTDLPSNYAIPTRAGCSWHVKTPCGSPGKWDTRMFPSHLVFTRSSFRR